MDDREDRELRAGLRHLHKLVETARRGANDVNKEVYTLLEVLVAKGVVTVDELTAKYPKIADRLDFAHRSQPAVELGIETDKYALEGLPEIDCEARLPLCRARCCTFKFPLAPQDLDEGVVKWSYAQPYRIRHGADGWCVHADPETKRCGVYRHRPAPCRIFDCRQDLRIWRDFERRIPASDDRGG
jgi:hypothetical protein